MILIWNFYTKKIAKSKNSIKISLFFLFMKKYYSENFLLFEINDSEMAHKETLTLTNEKKCIIPLTF